MYKGLSSVANNVLMSSITQSSTDDTADEPVATDSERKRTQSKKGGTKTMKKSEITESGKLLDSVEDAIFNSGESVLNA